MLSNFIKKLLFTRKFYMNNGSIEILDKKKVLLPIEVIHLLQRNDGFQDQVKEVLKNNFHDFTNTLGSKRSELLKNLPDLFDIYGLGKLDIISVDNDSKNAVVNIYNSTIAHVEQQKGNHTDKAVCKITSSFLAGIFSYLLDADVVCEEEYCFAQGKEFCRFIIKKEVMG